MEDIYYLVHTTNQDPKKWKNLNPGSIDDFEHQFPGVYLTLVTKQNIHKVPLYPDNTKILIFSKRLLEQNNYHINVTDHNGIISEENTYFPWNIDEALEKINKSDEKIGNEVVFHDPVSMKYLCTLIENKSGDASMNEYLPNVPIENKVEPNLKKLPFYCFPLEDNYTGIDIVPKSSGEFFKKMAKLCGVNSNLKKDKIVKETKTKIPELYNNRKKQDLSGLSPNPNPTNQMRLLNQSKHIFGFLKDIKYNNPLQRTVKSYEPTTFKLKPIVSSKNGGKTRKNRRSKRKNT
jgi:hypothetical protein